MALLTILHYPDPRLRNKAKVIATIDARIRKIAADMVETMYAMNGIGLAATQVGISERLFVMDVSENHKEEMYAINPEILSQEGERLEVEGCLSVPEAYDKVKRALKVRFRAQNLDGDTYELEAEGLMAHCIQHEVDHLNGILFIDRLSDLKRERLFKKIQKSRRQA